MKFLNFFQNSLIAVGVSLLVALPFSSLFFEIPFSWTVWLYQISFFSVFLVMIIRPLSDILNQSMWLKRLVFLRKGFGILSSSIIVGFTIGRIIASGSSYLSGLFSFDQYAILADIGDISGMILLATSNRLSQRLLRTYWKRIQKLAYVYFYAGAFYETLFLESTFGFYALLVVTNLVVLAWGVKVWRKQEPVLTLRTEESSAAARL